MPAYNFKSQFASAVVSGRKQQTIRAKRKTPPRVGQLAHCFVGMRTRNCRRLGSWPICSVNDVEILRHGVVVDGKEFFPIALDFFAVADGFRHWIEMRDWFERVHGLPFRGDLISWRRE
jgi:hypothetical protein